MAAKAGSWSARAEMVARWFGVGREGVESSGVAAAGVWPRVRLGGGRVVLLTGASGAGKSTFLRRLRRRSARRATWVDLPVIDDASAGDRLVIDVMTDAMGGGDDEASVVAGLEALSRVGLGEVWTYLRRPGELSEGQRWRLRVAVGLARAGGGHVGQARPLKGGVTSSKRPSPCPRAGSRPFRSLLPGYRERVQKPRLQGSAGEKLCVLAIDEFAAPLDRVTAMVVARALRKAVSARADLCAVVATSHDDLVGALAPDVVVRCDFGAFEVQHKKGPGHVAE